VGARRICILACIPLIVGYFLMTQLHVYTSTGFVVGSFALIGFGLGLLVTPVTTMIMTAVSKTKAGMISSLTSLERTAPLTIGIAIFNLLLIEGVIRIAKNYDVTTKSPADIQIQVLSAGFDFAFILSLVLGIVILILALVVKVEIHPDYAEEGESPAVDVL
jgi:hypothetical protein